MKTSKSLPNSNPNPPSRFWMGLWASCLIHSALISGILFFPEETLKLQAPGQTITLSLAKIESAPKQETPPPPEPVKETPPPPPPKEVKKELPKPKPKPVVKQTPVPVPKEEPILEESPAVAESHPQEVNVATSSAPAPSSILPQGEATATMETDRALLERIYAAILKHKSYPRQAIRMKMEGEVVLEFGLKDNGELSWVKVVRGSGYTLLDGHAMEVLKKASADFPSPNRRIKIQVPIAYELL